MSTTFTNPPVERMAERTSGLFLVVGLALAVLGVIDIAFSIFFTLGTVLLFGVLLVCAGIADFVHAFKTRERKGAVINALSGLLYLVAGGFLLFNPLAGALSLTLVISAFLFVAGIIRCINAITHRHTENWGWFLFSGVLDLALAVLIARGWPATGLWVIGLFVGIEMITHGIAWIALSSTVDKDARARELLAERQNALKI